MPKNYLIIILVILFYNTTFAQTNILCPESKLLVYINNLDNIPDVTENDDGTFTLTFNQEYITNIFSNYTIYDWAQAYPGNSPSAERLYVIFHDNNNLIEDLLNNVPSDIIRAEYSLSNPYVLPIYTPIDPNIISALNNKTFNLIKYVNTSDANSCALDYSCPLIDVPEDFHLQITFNYDYNNDMLYAEISQPSSCGNTFTIGLKGGYSGNGAITNSTLTHWQSLNWTSTPSEYSQICHNIENTLFSILGIACDNNNFDNIIIETDSETNNLRFTRINNIDGYDTIELAEANLASVDEQTFAQIRIFEKEGNPYLQISNLKNEPITIEIYTPSGQKIMNPVTFENNKINISHFENGIYFIKLSNLSNQQKVLKFLKN